MDEVPAHPRVRLESGPSAWLKIADGCNHRCAFCAIPAIKGPFASLPREFLLREARSLVRQGVRELNLIAQDITSYGNDLYPDYRLPELLRDLCAVPGDFRVRCLYAYPGGITDRLLDVMAGEGKVVPYLDIPLQHLVPEMLKRMRRPSATLGTARFLSRIRKRLPGAVLRTTLIAGFPGETRETFRETVSLLKECRFHWLGVFAYSPEEGTPAERFQDLPTETTRERRRLRLLEAQAAITAELNAARVGAGERLLVEHREPESGLWQCRGPFEAPEVDGTIWLSAAPGAVAVGDFVDARITASGIYDVFASPSSEG
jgi:ribosomal protein S12 methylthiotransferase